MPSEPSRGFVSALFDLRFEEFVTTRIIRVVYVLAIIGAAAYALLAFVAGIGLLMSGSSGAGLRVLGFLVAFGGAPLVFLAGVAIARVLLEVVMAVFKIEEHTRPR